MRNIILFGQMGAGKSSVAKHLVEFYTYRKYSLGEKIHQECKMHGNELRGEMQAYGQMMRKIFGENVWNNHTFNRMIEESSRHYHAGYLVIDDGRQLNEIEYWTKLGFVAVGITAEANIRSNRIFQRTGSYPTMDDMTHDTEMQAAECVKRCMLTLSNNGDMEMLITGIHQILIPFIERM